MTPRYIPPSDESLDLVNLRDIAERLGYHYNTVQAWWRQYEMPPPATYIGSGQRFPVWHWHTIEEWAMETGRTRPVGEEGGIEV